MLSLFCFINSFPFFTISSVERLNESQNIWSRKLPISVFGNVKRQLLKLIFHALKLFCYQDASVLDKAFLLNFLVSCTFVILSIKIGEGEDALQPKDFIPEATQMRWFISARIKTVQLQIHSWAKTLVLMIAKNGQRD